MTVASSAVAIFAVAALVFVTMWVAWRRRQRAGAQLLSSAAAPTGEVLASFTRVTYVSTNPVGEPLVRVALPGLVYKGIAELTIHRDGVTVQVTGEPAVHIPAAGVIGSSVARVRVGKAVERDGLALLVWRTADTELESSFRFTTTESQHEFLAAIQELDAEPLHPTVPHGSATDTETLQEDA